MTFERPELLALAPPLVLVVSLAVTAQWRRALRLIDAFGGRDAARRLAPRDLRPFPSGRLGALVAVVCGLTLTAAGPRPTVEPPRSRHPLDLMVVLDLSLSMSAEDVPGGRAHRATEILARLADALPDEQIGVAVFADWPYTLVPLTHDLDVVRYFGASLTPELVADRDQGTVLGAAVTHARATLERRRRAGADAVILVLSDGESYADPASVLDSVAVATAGGVRLWTGGVGTPHGAPLGRAGSPGEPLLDDAGAPVVAGMDEELLRLMAREGGGAYHDVSGEAGARALVEDLAGGAREPGGAGRGPLLPFWLTLLTLPLLLWEGSADAPHRMRLRSAEERA